MNKELVKSCKNCNHRKGSGEFAKCKLAYYCSIESRHGKCGQNYVNWERRLNLLERLDKTLSGR